MTSGLEWDEETFPYGDPRNDATAMERNANPVQFVLDRPVIRQPGTQFQYCGANSMLLSAILQEATGMSLAEFARQTLFAPLGISQYRWTSYPDGHTNTDGGLSLRPRDMAKIGQLMLNKGQWHGVQVVSPEWVAESTQAHTTIMPGQRYGYQWWRENQPIYLESVDPYFAAGYGGQLISVYPDQNMVVVVTSDTANHTQNSARIMYLRNKYLLPATIPALLSKTLLWSWYVLTAGGLIFLALEIVRGHIKGFGWSVIWLLIAALSGPLGIAVYLLSYRNKKNNEGLWLEGVGIVGICRHRKCHRCHHIGRFPEAVFTRWQRHPAGYPVSFLVSWLAFIAPLITCTRGMRYRKAVRQTLLTAFITSCFAQVGIFPVLVLLSIRWFPYDVDLASSLFWIMMTACGIAAAVVVYPFILWTVRRNLDCWLVGRVNGHEIEATGFEKRLPRFRDAWGAFSLGLILLIAVFGFLIMNLS